MQMVNRFIISPIGGQYVNEKEIAGQSFIVNTDIEDAVHVNRRARIEALPFGYKGVMRVGDEVIVQHNTFRITYRDDGTPVNSTNYIKDNLFYITGDLIYMFIRDGVKQSSDEYVFVKPIMEEHPIHGYQEIKHVGKLKYINEAIKSYGLNVGDTICFRKNAEYAFEIDGERLYLMMNRRILAKVNEN